MHCSDDWHNQLVGHALIFRYTLIPCFTSCGTSYRPLASPLPQLSILLLLDYGWYSGLGLRCGYLGVFLACISPCCVLAGASRLVTSERLPREDAIWPLPEGVSCGLEKGVLALGPLKDRVDLPPDAVSTFVQTAHLVMGGGAG
jgi:hypothetical protein